ncbi:MAG: hypothetical protein IJ097_03570 [Bacilli bacterium]|nr:hypothetical protein [Bacilli bacterium]
MYSLNNKKYKNKGKLIDKADILNIEGFMMGSKNKIFKIDGESIKDIRVVDTKLASSLVSKQVFKKYNKLINYLTELLTSDDDSGESCRQALNQIERFRVEIKTKYRKFLKQKELETMSKQLIILQKEAHKKMIEIAEKLNEYKNENKRSK